MIKKNTKIRIETSVTQSKNVLEAQEIALQKLFLLLLEENALTLSEYNHAVAIIRRKHK